jgi:hypothetical protein
MIEIETINNMINSPNKTDILFVIEILNIHNKLKYGEINVKSDLNLYNTPITSLPDNLKVGGDLYLRNTKITSLPDNLQVGGDLDLHNTKITSLPDNLKVGGVLDLGNTPITKKYTKGQIEQMIEDNGGHIEGNIYI